MDLETVIFRISLCLIILFIHKVSSFKKLLINTGSNAQNKESHDLATKPESF